MDETIQLIAQYRNKGILVDTNILVLLFVGATNRDRIERFKRTQQFMADDYDTLTQLLLDFSQIIVTPNILTEVNSLLNQLGEPERSQCLALFSQGISGFNEQYISSQDAARRETFMRFGLTDTGIVETARGKYLVLTDDLRLAVNLQSLGIDTVNFNRIRASNW